MKVGIVGLGLIGGSMAKAYKAAGYTVLGYDNSPAAPLHHGFSAGSYLDMTRVAPLNEVMWADLFLCNREPLLQEIDCLIGNLPAYRNVLEAGDQTGLTELLKAGRERWEEVDGETKSR